jgi:hypothetical protein
MGVLFDIDRDWYQVLRAGWLQKNLCTAFWFTSILRGEKLWVQYDGTEVGVAKELMEAGIPKTDIVLAYHSPFIRQYDGFAVG